MSRDFRMDRTVSVDAGFWRSLSPEDRRAMLASWGLPPLVMASFDRSTMTITMRTPTADDVVAAFDETGTA